MSVEVATEKWLDGHESGLLGQFASTRGYSDLIKAANGYAALSKFFNDGATDNVKAVQSELSELAKHGRADVKSTAQALLDLSKGQEFLVITNGAA